MTLAERGLVWFLRVTAVTLLSAAAAVVLPHAWMNAIHEGLGLGTLADQPLVGYLTRSLSALYACLGAASWYLSRDVPRHLPLLRFTVPVSAVFTVTLVGVNLGSGMPAWWTIGESVVLVAWTLALAYLVRQRRHHAHSRQAVG